MRGTVIYYQYDEKTGQLIFAEHICRMRRERLIPPTVRYPGRPDKTRTASHQAHCQCRMGTSDQSDLRHFWRRYAKVIPARVVAIRPRGVRCKKPC